MKKKREERELKRQEFVELVTGVVANGSISELNDILDLFLGNFVSETQNLLIMKI